MVTTTAAAMTAPVGCSNCEAPVKNASAAGTVRAFSDVSEMAKTKSFHAVKNVMLAVVNTPGVAYRSVTSRHGSARPSSRAALVMRFVRHVTNHSGHAQSAHYRQARKATDRAADARPPQQIG